MSNDKGCFTCKHNKMEIPDRPCSTCTVNYVYSQWEPEQPEPKTLTIDPGRVVKLKSGGPEMTVDIFDVETYARGGVHLYWFDNTGALCRATVHRSGLEVVR